MSFVCILFIAVSMLWVPVSIHPIHLGAVSLRVTAKCTVSIRQSAHHLGGNLCAAVIGCRNACTCRSAAP